MFSKYREILSIPGALRFSLAGLTARFSMALVGISTILMIRGLYGNYALAGIVSGASVIAFAIGAPLLSRMVDAHGQARVMIPAILTSATATVGLIFAAMHHAPLVLLLVLSAVAGALAGSMGSLVRARWAFVTQRPGQIQAAYSLEAAFDEVAFVLGPVIATLACTSIHPTAGLWLTAIINVVGALWFLSQKQTEPPARRRIKVKGERPLMLHPVMIVLAFTYVGAGALFGANDLAVVAFTDEQGLPGIAGVLLAVFAFGSLMGALVYGTRTWRWPLWKLFIVGIFALAIGASTFVLASSIPVLALIMVLTGLVIAPTMTNVSTIVQRIMPANRLTEGLAWMSTAMNIGVSVGSGMTGPIIDSSGAHGGFLVVIGSAWLMVLAAMIGLRALRRGTEGSRMIKE